MAIGGVSGNAGADTQPKEMLIVAGFTWTSALRADFVPSSELHGASLSGKGGFRTHFGARSWALVLDQRTQCWPCQPMHSWGASSHRNSWGYQVAHGHYGNSEYGLETQMQEGGTHGGCASPYRSACSDLDPLPCSATSFASSSWCRSTASHHGYPSCTAMSLSTLTCPVTGGFAHARAAVCRQGARHLA